MSDPVSCPACKKTLPIKGIPKHVSGCPSWSSKISIPPSDYNWDLYFKRGPYAEGLLEGTDWVRCQLCFSEGRDARFKRMMDHLKKVHSLTEESYLASYPGASVRIEGTRQKREKTVRARYGVENVFQAISVKREIRDSMIRNYGAPSPLQVPALRAKVAATNLERFGVENPFASPEVQAKIRKTNLDRFGVANPNQSPVFRLKTIESNIQKYGSPVPQGFGLERKTRPEEIVDAFKIEGLYYTGNRSYWVRCEGGDGVPKNRNPDFVVYAPEQIALVNSGTPPNEVRTNKIVEVIGDWWHREEIVGLPRDAYVASRIKEYASIRISCLVIWESEVKTQPEEVRARLADWCR